MVGKKKNCERALLIRLLECMGEDPDAWVIEEERERPDFVLRSPRSIRVGIEMTELLTSDQGRDRATDNRVAVLTRRVVSEHLRSLGGTGGAIIDGTTDRLPQREPVGLVNAIESHLAQHGKPLLKDGGVLEEPLRHAWGEILYIERNDSVEQVLLLESRHPQPLKYKAESLTAGIESKLVEIVRRKAEKGKSYHPGLPLWLAVRNPNQSPLLSVRPESKEKIRVANQGVFARVLLFNFPQDILSNCLPTPAYVDLLE